MKTKPLNRVEKMQAIARFESLIHNLAGTQLQAAQKFLNDGVSSKKVDANLEAITDVLQYKNTDLQNSRTVDCNCLWITSSAIATALGFAYVVFGAIKADINTLIGGGVTLSTGFLCLVTSSLNCVRLDRKYTAEYKDLSTSVEKLMNAIYNDKGYFFTPNEIGSLNVAYNDDHIGVMKF